MLERTAQYIESQFKELDLKINTQQYTTSDGYKVRNIEGSIIGADPSISLVIGAHYDSVSIHEDPDRDCPGANDNHSGVAVLLELGRLLASMKTRPRYTVRVVAFANEKPPYFLGKDMGSHRYAERLASTNEKLLGMICLETVGYYSDRPGSQMIPPPVNSVLNHDRGNFVAFMGDPSSADFLKTVAGNFAEKCEIPCAGLIGDHGFIGMEMSDQVSFWRQDFKAIMVTDTLFMRIPKPYAGTPTYHTRNDTWEKINYGAWRRLRTG